MHQSLCICATHPSPITSHHACWCRCWCWCSQNYTGSLSFSCDMPPRIAPAAEKPPPPRLFEDEEEKSTTMRLAIIIITPASRGPPLKVELPKPPFLLPKRIIITKVLFFSLAKKEKKALLNSLSFSLSVCF